MIKTQSHQFSVMTMCRLLSVSVSGLLSVSVSGYYHWLNREPSVREKANLTLASKIKVIFDDEKSRAGAHRITHRLNAEGDFSSRHRVARIMRLNGWRARASKKFKATTNSNHRLPVAPNLLEQNFLSQRPNEKWVSDITYIWTEEGWLYLAVVMDLYSRLVVGWALSERMTAKLVIDALQMALWHRKPPRNLIVHSDRGSQYCALEYQKLFVQHGLICSMSKRGDCFDNAAMESWNHSFKVEAIHGEKLITRAFAKNHVLAKNHVFEYIEIYYNRKRLHSTIGYKTPASFDIKMVA